MMGARAILDRLKPQLKLVVLFLGLTYLLLFASSHNGLVNASTLTVTAVVLSVVALLFVIWRRQASLSVELPLWVFLVVILLSCATSMDPRRSLVEVWLAGIIIVLILFSAEMVRRGWSAETWITVLLMVGAVMMILSWLEVFAWHLQSYRVTGSLFPTIHFRLSVPNFIGVFLNILLMLALARLVAARSLGQRLVYGIWALSAILLIYLSSSRGAWLGTVAGIGILALAYMLRRYGSFSSLVEHLSRRKWLVVLSVAGLLVLVTALVILFLRQSQHPTHASSILQSRAEFWGPAWQAFLQNPLLGRGPYTFISQFLLANSVPPSNLFVYSHSIYFDLLSGSGLLGLAAFLWLAYRVIRSLVDGLKAASMPEFVVLAGALGSIAAFLVHGVFDSVHHTVPTAGWTFALIVGVALGVRGDYCKMTFDLPRWLSVSVALAAWLNLWLLAPLDQAVKLAWFGNWQAADTAIQVAVDRDPFLAAGYQQAALIQAHLTEQGDPAALQRSLLSWYQATVTDPAWALNQANYGVMLRVDRQLDRSESALAQAVHLAPGSAVYWLNYAVTLEQNKKDAEADQAYRQALDRHPDWQPAYFWRETPLRLQAWRSWSVDQPVSDTSSLEELERTAQAAPDLATNHLALARAYLDDQRWEQAANSLALARLAYAATAGTSVEIDWLTAEVYAGQGDYQQAVVFGDRALSNQVHQGLFGPGSYGILYYVEFMFRRPAVPDDLVPQTLLVAMPDAWGYRVLDLVGWHRALGAHARADDLMQQLAIWIPDYPYILVEGGS